MMSDVRNSTNDEMLVVYNKFKTIKPQVSWYDERPTLVFENKTQKLTINDIYLQHGSLWLKFYPGVDNIRFDGTIKINDEIKNEINEFIKHGTSKNVLDYI